MNPESGAEPDQPRAEPPPPPDDFSPPGGQPSKPAHRPQPDFPPPPPAYRTLPGGGQQTHDPKLWGYGYLPPTPTPRPPSRHPTSTLVWIAIGALIFGVLVGGGIVGGIWAYQEASSSSADGVQRDSEDPVAGHDAPRPDIPVDPNAPLASDVIDEELPGLLEFVETERDLEFTEDVEVEFLDEEDFDDAFDTEIPPDEAEGLRGMSATYSALGLTTNPDAYFDAWIEGDSSGILGFYDPATSRLVVRGVRWTPMVETTIVHELTHALQDQHFDIDAMLAQAVSPLAIRSLVEGDAQVVEGAYVLAQSSEWQTQYESELDRYPLPDENASFAATLSWIPYWHGYDMVTVLDDADAVDDAFRDPPTTDEQVLLTEEWLAGDPVAAPAVDVDTPDAPEGAEVIHEGTLGAAVLGMLPLDLDVDYYDGEYLDGWQGDSYVTYDDGEYICTFVTVKFDDDAATTAANRLMLDWTSRTRSAMDVNDDDPSQLSLKGCVEPDGSRK